MIDIWKGILGLVFIAIFYGLGFLAGMREQKRRNKEQAEKAMKPLADAIGKMEKKIDGYTKEYEGLLQVVQQNKLRGPIQ